MGRNFKTLKAWELADNLAVELYRVTQAFPKEEQYGLTSQVRRAAVSVAANIAEGSSRRTKKDLMHFLVIARASLAEVEYYIHLTQRLGYLGTEEGMKLSAMLKETAITLNGYINSIRTAEQP
jgi:four helix bundle protein